jgi:predicted ABC-type transport system involved in lysophospholipase L1 biosynthesis ATPase subunit
VEAKARHTLGDLGLQHRLSYFPHQLSIGQKRRVAIARALLLDPVVIFADEPTNDLDPERAAWVGDFLFGLPQQGRALILATHDTSLAVRAGRVFRIGEGRVEEAVGAEPGATRLRRAEHCSPLPSMGS